MKKFQLLATFATILISGAAQAALIQGTPASGAGEPTPRFGTLIDFDDQATGSSLAANQYVGQGVTSIINSLGPTLGYYETSQSTPNYVGTGPDTGWAADILVEFAALQAAVGIGIAGPTTLTFQLLGADMGVLESYVLATTPFNTYYYINRASADTQYLRVVGNFVAIDDLQFSTRTVPQDVPEPAALALFGLGLLGMAAARRRKAS